MEETQLPAATEDETQPAASEDETQPAAEVVEGTEPPAVVEEEEEGEETQIPAEEMQNAQPQNPWDYIDWNASDCDDEDPQPCGRKRSREIVLEDTPRSTKAQMLWHICRIEDQIDELRCMLQGQ